MKKIYWLIASFVFFYSATFAQTSLPAPKMTTLPGNIKLEYVEQGNTSGVPVIFLHGYSDSWHSFETVLPQLGASVHAYAITLRGHGNSDKPRGSYDVSVLAADVASFMKEMNIASAVIVGHSLGSTVAQKFAIDYPAKTAGLVLVSTFAKYRGLKVLAEFKTMIDNLTDPVDAQFINEFQAGTIATPVPTAFFNTMVQESAKLPAYVWKGVANGFIKTDFVQQLTGVKVPTLLLWGDKDGLCPLEHQQLLIKTMPVAELNIYKGIGHALHWEQPERFVSDLEQFIKRKIDLRSRETE